MIELDLASRLVFALILHDVGDYLTQSDWMANQKTKSSLPAAAHALVYTLPFLLVSNSPAALAVIGFSHFAIDRWRLARYVCWAKNFLGPRSTADGSIWWHPWTECSGTGYHKDKPPWMTVWLMIRADNTLHHLINFLVIAFL